MQLTIDNLAGAGPQDYTPMIDASAPVVVERSLNEPSVFVCKLFLGESGFEVPVRYARVAVSCEGVTLFTGYIAEAPAYEYIGQGDVQVASALLLQAYSDEVILDSATSGSSLATLGNSLAQVAQSLQRFSGVSSINVATPGPSPTNSLILGAGSRWSEAVGEMSKSVGMTYRAVGGQISFSSIGAVLHQVEQANAQCAFTQISTSSMKLLATDVTVCGRIEPSAYISELFAGDGVTASFQSTHAPFSLTAPEKLSVFDDFSAQAINPQLWSTFDPGAHVSVSSSGLTCEGGTGQDGSAVVSLLQGIELGGSIVVELGGLQLNIGSSGVLGGLYVGEIGMADCLAGVSVSTSGGQLYLQALVEGEEAGSAYKALSGQVYSLRVRLYTPEVERMLPAYYYLNGSGVGSYGGTTSAASGFVSIEVQNITSGAPGPVATLFSGALPAIPAIATLGLLNSTALFCSIASFSVRQVDAAWVTMAPSNGSPVIQRIDTAADGGTCTFSSEGHLTFHSGCVPPAGSLIQLSYRGHVRAVARRALQTVASSAQAATPQTQTWVGTVSKPIPRSSVDCENAAAALLQSSSSNSACLSGKYSGWQLETQGDIWPGDLLQTLGNTSSLPSPVVVRGVKISLGPLTKYEIAFANAWAEDLCISMTEAIPTDVALPTSAIAGNPLVSLSALAVTSVTTALLQVNAGTVAPAGGGFEVRRSDWGFGPGVDSDLVLRSPVQNFSIPRLAASEQFYVRMYDGSSPPNYSRFSAAVITNLPLSV